MYIWQRQAKWSYSPPPTLVTSVTMHIRLAKNANSNLTLDAVPIGISLHAQRFSSLQIKSSETSFGK
jgi:hypothetical protein